jgi:N-methylhydantoinase A
MRQGGVRVGVDIGGTFTDIVVQRADGALIVNKTSSTPQDLSDAVLAGLQSALAEAGVQAADVVEIVHGTTVASNTLLQKSGARTGVLTTKGFRDVLEIGRIRTPTMFDLTWVKPEPLAPRRHRLEVAERIGADGTVVTPLDEDGVRAAGRRFVAEGVEAVAICFLNSYANPAHERAAQQLLEREFPSLSMTASCAVLPEIKEYERTSTTVVNAYILRAMRAYLSRLAARLRDIGIGAPLLVVASHGGMMGAAAASERPVFAVASGPAGGVSGAARLGQVVGDRDVVVFDMGGTTAKASIIEDGVPALTSEYEFREGMSSPSRFIKGGGYLLKVPSIDIAEVGSGGGSLAAVDQGGLLLVGPASAGADPGPACYGLGNGRPTVTDANLLLGFLNPAGLAGGALQVDRARSEEAIARHIATPLGLSAVDAAHGIREVATVTMARAIRAVTVERGRDPRDMTLMAFGGNGPVFAVERGRQLGIRRILVPPMSGVFCAAGMLASDVEHSYVRTLLGRLDRIDAALVAAAVAALTEEGGAALAAEGYGPELGSLRLFADLRYEGQSSDLSVALPDATLTAATRAALHDAFQTEYRRVFGYTTDDPLELVNLRLVATGRRPGRLDFATARVRAAARRPAATRPVSFARGAPFVDTPVLAREALDGPTPGPLILEAYDTTIVVPAGATAAPDPSGSVILALSD